MSTILILSNFLGTGSLLRPPGPPPMEAVPLVVNSSVMYSAPPTTSSVSAVPTVKMTAPTVPSTSLMTSNKQITIPTAPDLKVFIGGFPTELRDDFFEAILHEAGSLAAWERFVDPVTKKKSNFGFAHFATRDMAITAAKVLHSVKFSTSCLIRNESNIVPEKVDVTLIAKNDNNLSSMSFLSETDEQNLTQIKQKLISEIPFIEAKFLQQAEHEHILKSDNEKEAPTRSRREILRDEETVSEQEIDLFARVDPRAPGINDEVYMDLVKFRRIQAKDEIVSTRRRRRLIEEMVPRIREKQRLKQQKTISPMPAPGDVRRRMSSSNEYIPPTRVEEPPKQQEMINSMEDLSSVNISFETKTGRFQDKNMKKPGSSSATFTVPTVNRGSESKSRKLVPIQYSKEEIDAVKSDKEKMKESVYRAIERVLGESDESFAQFVIGRIKKGISRRGLIRDVKDVLEEESEEFADDLQRFLL